MNQASTMDTVVPGDKWEFDESVTQCFDNMLERSIPGYPLMRSMVDSICQHQIDRLLMLSTPPLPQKVRMLDVGSSRGESFERLLHNDNLIVDAIEPSEAMNAFLRNRYACNENVCISAQCVEDFLDGTHTYHIISSILTLQFIPIEDRFTLFTNLYRSLADNGIMVLVEKVLSSNGPMDSLLTKLYYDFKKANGYTQQDIDAKRKSLRGVMSPISANWNEQALREAGFSIVEPFFRAYNFAGWIAIKDSSRW